MSIARSPPRGDCSMTYGTNAAIFKFSTCSIGKVIRTTYATGWWPGVETDRALASSILHSTFFSQNLIRSQDQSRVFEQNNHQETYNGECKKKNKKEWSVLF